MVTSIIRLISVLLAKQIHWVVEIYSCYLFLFVFKIRLRFTSIYSPFEKKLSEVPFINYNLLTSLWPNRAVFPAPMR